MSKLKRQRKPHRLADKLLEYYCRNELLDSIQGDMHEQFLLDLKKYSVTRSQWRYWVNVVTFINRFTLKKRSKPTQSNTTAMIYNYLLITLRNIKIRPVFSLINLFGLAAGLATCMFIFLYIQHETSFDGFHKNAHNIYRVANVYERNTGANFFTRTPPILASAIRDNLPGVSKASRSQAAENYVLKVNNENFEVELGLFADSVFLEIFDYPLLSGDRFTALDEPNTIVLGKALATRLYGNENPLGKTLSFAGDIEVKVTGILDELPSNTHLKFDYLVSFSALIIPETFLADLNSWGWCGFYTYLELDESVNTQSLKIGIDSLIGRNYTNSGITAYSILQPLQDVYLKSGNLTNHGAAVKFGSMSNVYALTAIAVLVLIVASFNFMNLSTAMSLNRGKEIGVRKVMGAIKGRIRTQFLVESMVLSLFSMVIALILLWLVTPLLLNRLQVPFRLSLTENLTIIPLFISFSLIVGLLSGLYPSVVLSAFNPITALKGHLKTSKRGVYMRKGLTLFQFIISLCLIAISLLVVQQVAFMRDQPLGFDKDKVLVVDVFAGDMTANYAALKDQLNRNPNIIAASMSSEVFAGSPASSPVRLLGGVSDDALQLSYYQAGYDFQQLMGIELLQGRFFSKSNPRDRTEALVLNETAVKQLGLTEPLGQRVTFTNREMIVVGVVRDFHVESLHTAIRPMGIIMPFSPINRMLVKANSDNYSEIMASLERDVKSVIPGSSVIIRFMEEGIQELYEREESLSRLITFFSILAVLLACLGLYGLVSFSVQARIKEVGVRKVLGASVSGMLILLSREFLWLILLASLMAWPLIYFIGNSWLNNFSYRLSIGVSFFVIPTLLLLTLAIITLSHQVFKATLSNPVKVLRSE